MSEIKYLSYDDLTPMEQEQVMETYLYLLEIECGYERETPEFLEENPDWVEGVKTCKFERERNYDYVNVIM